MKILWTNSSTKALEEIKRIIIEKYKNKDTKRLRLKFTKKKEFIANPVSFFGCPAFQLFINGKEYKTYLFKNNKWKEL